MTIFYIVLAIVVVVGLACLIFQKDEIQVAKEVVAKPVAPVVTTAPVAPADVVKKPVAKKIVKKVVKKTVIKKA